MVGGVDELQKFKLSFTLAHGIIVTLMPIETCLFSVAIKPPELIRKAMFPTSFSASTLHINREFGCGLTEFRCTEVWFPDKENEILSPCHYESNMHANFFFFLNCVSDSHRKILLLLQRKKKVKFMLHACKAF